MLDDIKAGHPVETVEGYPIEVLKIFEGNHGHLIAGVYRVGKEGAYVSGLWDDEGNGIQDHPDMKLKEMVMDVRWDLLSEGVQYVTMDPDGDFELHIEEPLPLNSNWSSRGDYYGVPGVVKLLNTPYDPVYWKFSLTERP